MKKMLIISLMSTFIFASETMKVYKNVDCGCCESWTKYMKNSGYNIEVHNISWEKVYSMEDKANGGNLQACHIAYLGKLAVIGHVPVEDVKKAMKDKDIVAITAPGMPQSGPGMDIGHEPFDVVATTSTGKRYIYSKHNYN